MNIEISLEYFTLWGERLVVNVGGKRIDMTPVFTGKWSVGFQIEKSEQYTFELWRGETCIRTEWRKHELPENLKAENVIIRERWSDRPFNSPFYSSLFKNVIFARNNGKNKGKGNVTFRFYSPEIRPDQAIAITGSGKLFSDWKKFIILEDGNFPEWSVSLKVKEPFEYKFAIVDKGTGELTLWENSANHFFAEVPQKDTHIVVSDYTPGFNTELWRGAGTAVPVFSLRTEDSFGVGEFRDIRKMADFAVKTGQNIIQLLPINDTTMTGTWVDSYPYNANSTFALHPQFISLEEAGARKDKEYKQLQTELNALKSVDYERVNYEKNRILKEIFEQDWNKISESKAFREFYKENEFWLLPYAVFCCLRDNFGTPDFHKWASYSEYSEKKVKYYCKKNSSAVNFHYFVQFELDRQLKEAVRYAHSKGVALKGDLPIGISRTSVDAWMFPELFHLDSQAGAPPDAFSTRGQNWGFPTYNWEKMSEDGYEWWKKRMKKMSEYFDAFRIDHILGFFRIWEIPVDTVDGLLGYFNPALPFSEDELRDRGFDLWDRRYCRPLVYDWVLEEIFGDLASEVKEKYISGGKLADKVSTQRKVIALFKKADSDEKQRRLRDGLLGLIADVLFIEDPRKKGYFHPRISAQHTLVYKSLNEYQRSCFNRLYDEFFYHRNDQFWRESAMRKLPELIDSTDMLACGEDLGMIPDCVPSTMKELNILSLEIQRMPKSVTETFANPEHYPYFSVCATGTHDTSNIRSWWEEDRDISGRFYREMLHKAGETPYFCDTNICNSIIRQHLHSPSMLAILPLSDWLSIDTEVRYPGNPADERINVPAIAQHYWKYRMHLSIEDLLRNEAFCTKLHDRVTEAGRE